MEEKEAAKLSRDNLAYERENKKLVKEYHKLSKKHKRLQKDFKNLSGENDRNKRLLRSKVEKPTVRKDSLAMKQYSRGLSDARAGHNPYYR